MEIYIFFQSYTLHKNVTEFPRNFTEEIPEENFIFCAVTLMKKAERDDNLKSTNT